MSTLHTDAVDLFTSDEDAVLAQWFAVKPPSKAQNINVDEAIARLGFAEQPGYRTLIDVAVANIVLTSVETRLPQWIALRGDELILARKYRDRAKAPNRRVLLQPVHLLTINWADSGPGFSWPVAYYVTWLPIYDRFVITASADSPDAFGYCDFALGSFGIETPIKKGSSAIIAADWNVQHEGWDQQRWAYLFDTGLITEEEADALANGVWCEEADTKAIEDTDAA